MGISRDSKHKRRATGGRMPVHRKKRAFEKGRPISMTKLTTQSTTITEKRRIRPVRVRGGHLKFRALRLYEGNFSWGSENVTRKTKILDVKYNATNNELVRTKTLVKNSIVEIDSTPFREWYKLHYGIDLGLKKDRTVLGNKEKSRHVQKRVKRTKGQALEKNIEEQFLSQRILACISSRPGQSGRADGYILEGKELEFYVRKLQSKKK
ncbi:hypothetical protein ABPG74_006273 [Tetrahymena malaccensis]